MATTKSAIELEYPLAVYNYLVTVDGDETMSFSEVSGLEIDYDHVLHRHGMSWLLGDKLIRGQRKPINLTLKRGIVKSRKYLYDWIRSEIKKDVSIQLCDEKGVPVVTWQVRKALPLKFDSPSFSASANEVAVESLDLIAHDLIITYQE